MQSASRELLEKYFGWYFPSRGSGLSVQLGCSGSCEAPGMGQIHNPDQVC